MAEWIPIHQPREDVAASAGQIMEDDSAIAEGFGRDEVRPFRVSLLRGREMDANRTGG